MAHSLPYQDYPSLSRETLDWSLESLKSQYEPTAGQRACMITPRAMYLEQLPSYNEFFVRFLVPNQLCILSERATKQWRSRRDWVCEDGSPNFDFLRENFGDATVPVANCKHKEFSAHAKQEIKMEDFIKYWQQYRDNGHPSVDDSFYLKDWHFTRDFPDYKAYSTTSFFRSDWMNEFWDVREDIDDDYRFVYMGPKGTWTPFHADVFRSFSWSANICGKKRWIFFPPGEEEHLKDIHGTLVYDVTSTDLQDPCKYPNACKARNRIEILQQPGETIFVPSGWHHQVENLEDTISINHNWLNGCNVRLCWAHLKASLIDVQQEISDCCDMDGWDQQCQMILRALTGLDYEQFFWFMQSVARRRIGLLDAWKTNDASVCSSTTSVAQGDKDMREMESADRSDTPHVSEFLDMSDSKAQKVVENSDELFPVLPNIEEYTERHEVLPEENASKAKNETDSNRRCQNDYNQNQRVDNRCSCAVGEVCSCMKQLLLSSCSVECKANVESPVPPLPSGLCHIGNGAAPDQVQVSSHEPVGDDLDLLSGVPLISQDQERPHWSHCNVHHALFDLASIALVLKDMIAHVSVTSLQQIEGHESDNPDLDKDKGSCEFLKDKGENSQETKENKSCSDDGRKGKCPETCVNPEYNIHSIKLLLADIACTLSKFRVQGDWNI